jgi:DNA-binding transcriptional ArsR family regulator
MLDHLITPNLYLIPEVQVSYLKSKPSTRVKKIAKLTNLLRSISHPVKLSIVEMLNRRDEIELVDMCSILQSRESSISRHLTSMQEAGIIKMRKTGRGILYSLANKNTSRILSYIN